MTQEHVNAAFDALLSTVTFAGDIHLDDGTIYYPEQSTPYLVGKLSSYIRTPLGVGADCVFGITGSYTISVVRPTLEGRSMAGQIAGQIIAMFPRGTALVVGTSQTVTVTNAAEQPPVLQADWLRVPVVVSYIGSDPS